MVDIQRKLLDHLPEVVIVLNVGQVKVEACGYGTRIAPRLCSWTEADGHLWRSR